MSEKLFQIAMTTDEPDIIEQLNGFVPDTLIRWRLHPNIESGYPSDRLFSAGAECRLEPLSTNASTDSCRRLIGKPQ
ncbi:MAG: hypothetical protein AB8B87_24445 [Granulosicoccus sp.]